MSARIRVIEVIASAEYSVSHRDARNVDISTVFTECDEDSGRTCDFLNITLSLCLLVSSEYRFFIGIQYKY